MANKISLAWLKYTPQENGQVLKDWNFSLASSLARGGRILIEGKQQKECCALILNADTDIQEDFFKKILSATGKEAQEI